MSSKPFTENDLSQALQDAIKASPSADGYTIRELQDLKPDWSQPKVREAVRKLILSGRVQVVRIRRPAMDGRMASVPGYQFLKAKK